MEGKRFVSGYLIEIQSQSLLLFKGDLFVPYSIVEFCAWWVPWHQIVPTSLETLDLNRLD